MKLGVFYRIIINGEKWKYRFLSEKAADKVCGNITAHTLPREKTIEFRASDFTFGVAVHELFHAYCSYLYLTSSNVTNDNFEEIIAEMLEDRILVLITQARQMEAKFLESKSHDIT